MTPEQRQSFAEVLVSVLLSEKIVPAQVLARLGDLVSDNDPGFRSVLRKVWDADTQERQSEGGSARSIEMPIFLTAGFNHDTAEEELGRVLPEEKILINKEIFRKKLKNVNFGALDPRKEQVLIEELRSDAIGMSREETALYFNLIKISSLSTTVNKSISVANVDYPNLLLRLTEQAFGLTPTVLAKLNGGRPIARDQLLNILEVSIRQNKINARVLAVLLGAKTDKYLKKLVRFIELAVTQRGEAPEEILQHFGFYLLVNTADEGLLKTLDLSAPLLTFVTNKIGRMREIYYVTMLFAITFFVVLLSQITEIAGKFQESPTEQQGKLIKLYQSDERLSMLLQNASNLATRRIAEYKVEGREVQNNLKRFLQSNSDLVTAADLFKTDYRPEAKS